MQLQLGEEICLADDIPHHDASKQEFVPPLLTDIWVCNVMQTANAYEKATVASIVIDSGDTSSVCYIELLRHQFESAIPMLTGTGRKFRLGDGRIPQSRGKVISPGNTSMLTWEEGKAADTPFGIQTSAEIAEARIPLLLSLRDWREMSAVLDLGSQQMQVKGVGSIKVNVSQTGHLDLPFDFPLEKCRVDETETQKVYPVQGEGEGFWISEQIRRLHLHLGRASVSYMKEMVHRFTRPTRMKDINAVFKSCACWGRRIKISNIIANSHVSRPPGLSIFMDIMYLEEKTRHGRPHLMILDSFSRFTPCSEANSMRLIYGRYDQFSAIEHGQLQPTDILSHEESVRQNHLMLTMKARNAMIFS